MSIEKTATDQAYCESSEQEQREMSFGVAVRKAVDDLFTYKVIAERLQQVENNSQSESILNHHKQLLVEHIQEIAGRSIEDCLAQLDGPQAQPGLPFSALSDQRDEIDNRVE